MWKYIQYAYANNILITYITYVAEITQKNTKYAFACFSTNFDVYVLCVHLNSAESKVHSISEHRKRYALLSSFSLCARTEIEFCVSLYSYSHN